MVDNSVLSAPMPSAHDSAGPIRAVSPFVPVASAFDLRHVTAAIRSNLRLIAAIMAAAFAVSILVTLLMTARYTASATVQINDSGGHILDSHSDGEDRDGNGGAGGGDTDRFLQTQTDVLKSKALALRVAQRLNLMGDPRFFASQEASVPDAHASPDLVRAKVQGLLRTNLVVTLPHDSRIVTIAYQSTNPEISAAVANTYASEYIQSNLQRKFDSSSYARQFLSQQLDGARKHLEESERALNSYTRQTGLIVPQAMGANDGKTSGAAGVNSVTTASLLQANAAANEATTRRITAEAHWNAVANLPLMDTPEVIANPTVSALLTQRAQLQADLSQDRSRHLASYPSVLAKESQLAELNRSIRSAATNVRDSVKAEFTAATASEKHLDDEVKTLKSDTLAEQDQTVQYNLLSHDTDSNRQVYDGLLQRYKDLNAVAGASLSNVSIIDPAEPPTIPTSPSLVKNLVLGLLIGLALTTVVVFAKDQFDDSIRVPEDLESKLELRQLGVIPKLHSISPDDALLDPKSSISEAYNSLRGVLLYSTPRGMPQIMQITSAQPSEGKTTTSYAIAVALSRMNKSVLLIDSDLRRPALHRKVDFDNDRGLSVLLTSRVSLASQTVPSEHPGLTFLTSGPIPASPTELLQSTRFEEILHEAASQFEIILIDSPPVLGIADAPIVAPLVDGVLFIVEADRSRRGALKLALRRMKAMNPIMLGAVLTKFDAQKAGSDYYEYYGYSYYQYGNSNTGG